MVPCVNDNNPLARKRPFHWISMKSRFVRAAKETLKFQNWTHLTNSRRRYMAKILPIRYTTISNQSYNIDFRRKLHSMKSERFESLYLKHWWKINICLYLVVWVFFLFNETLILFESPDKVNQIPTASTSYVYKAMQRMQRMLNKTGSFVFW